MSDSKPHQGSSTSSQKLYIYVAGVPSRMLKSEILAYFKQFGPIQGLDTFHNQDDSESDKKRSYCRIQTSSWSTFNKILENKNHILKDRPITCTKYYEGDRLMRLNRLRNKRRLVINHIPEDMKLEELKSLLESEFGTVEVIYEFKGDCSSASEESFSQQKLQDSNKAASVVMDDQAAAQALIAKGQFPVRGDGSYLTVSKFKPQSNKKKFKHQPAQISELPAYSATKGHPTSAGTASCCNSSSPRSKGQLRDEVAPTSKEYFDMRRGTAVYHEHFLQFPLNVKFNRPVVSHLYLSTGMCNRAFAYSRHRQPVF